MAASPDPWLEDVEKRIRAFANTFGATYSVTERQQSAAFEIGCLLLLADDYTTQDVTLGVENLAADGSFRYLTSPNGKPQNFSWMRVGSGPGELALRQQVRVRSHLHPDITFTPDFVLMEAGAPIDQVRDPDYAGGKRGLFAVSAAHVVSVFECKSLPGFPELFVSFVGIVSTAHDWLANKSRGEPLATSRGHLAPTLFVGGAPSNLHRRMVTGLEAVFPMNIVAGLHRGGWSRFRKDPLKRLPIGGGAPQAGATETVDIPF